MHVFMYVGRCILSKLNILIALFAIITKSTQIKIYKCMYHYVYVCIYNFRIAWIKNVMAILSQVISLLRNIPLGKKILVNNLQRATLTGPKA